MGQRLSHGVCWAHRGPRTACPERGPKAQVERLLWDLRVDWAFRGHLGETDQQAGTCGIWELPPCWEKITPDVSRPLMVRFSTLSNTKPGPEELSTVR